MKILPLGCACILLLYAAVCVSAQAPVCHSLTASSLTYSQNFDTLANSGTVTGPLPSGFGFAESGSSANNSYTAGSGTSSAGETWSFGSTGSTDRAFGGIRVLALIPTIGACFVNNTGMPISALNITYDGEQWRLGATGRNDRLDFQYSLDATSLSDGTWIDVDTLDFIGPNDGSTGNKNGNNSSFRVAGITSTISSLSVSNGSTFYIRFSDFDAPSSVDDGLAVDNFSLTATIPIQTVTKTADTNDGVCDADCSLREAVAASVSGDTVVFASPLFDSAQTITLTLGTNIFISSKNLTITGTGANKLTIDGGAGTNRVFAIDSSTVTLSGMTLTGGGGTGSIVSGAGGAIIAGGSGTLTLDGLYITGNSATNGGGIYASISNTVIRNSTFSGNSASNVGGAIASTAAGAMTITNSTVSGNMAPNGAIMRFSGTSTEMAIRNSTIANNSGTTVGGIYPEGTIRLGSSIVAGNSGTALEIGQGLSHIVSEGYNLVGDSAGDSSNTGVAVTYHPTDIRDTDPQLGALGYNIGPTPVHTPAAGSPVVDQGSAFGSTTDQRGSARTSDNPSVANAAGGDGTDIGSVELQAALAGEVALTGRVTTALGRPIRGAQIIVQPSNGVTRRVLTSQFGFYRISGLEAGETYTITVSAKRHRFTAASRTVTPADNLTGLDFVASP